MENHSRRECESFDGHALWKSGVVRIWIWIPWVSTERLDHPTTDAWFIYIGLMVWYTSFPLFVTIFFYNTIFFSSQSCYFTATYCMHLCVCSCEVWSENSDSVVFNLINGNSHIKTDVRNKKIVTIKCLAWEKEEAYIYIYI